jgi:hypothetical protein
MSSDHFESENSALQNAFARLNMESDEESIASSDADVPDDLMCRGLFEASYPNAEETESGSEETDEEIENDGSQRSLDVMQSPRGEDEGKDPAVFRCSILIALIWH